MTIRFASVPEDVTRNVEAGLAELARAGAFTGRWDKLAHRGLTLAGPLAVYAAEGAALGHAQLVGYRWLLVRHREALAAADAALTRGGAFGLAMLNDGEQVSETLNALRAAEDVLPDGDYEARFLVLPGGEAFVWFAGAMHQFIAVAPLRSGAPCGTRLTEEDLLRSALTSPAPAPPAMAAPPLPRVLRTTALAAAPVVLAGQPQTKVLNFLIQNQQQTNWCWAAVTSSVYQYYTGNITTWQQCTVVNNQFVLNSCCENGSTAQCNKGGFCGTALQAAGCLNASTGAATQAQTETAIDASQPLSPQVGWFSGGAHVMVIYGYTQSGGPNDVIYIADPWSAYGYSAMNFDNFPAGYQTGGTWTNTFFTKHP